MKLATKLTRSKYGFANILDACVSLDAELAVVSFFLFIAHNDFIYFNSDLFTTPQTKTRHSNMIELTSDSYSTRLFFAVQHLRHLTEKEKNYEVLLWILAHKSFSRDFRATKVLIHSLIANNATQRRRLIKFNSKSTQSII